MTLRDRLTRRHIGAALGADRLVAMLPSEDGGAPWVRPLQPASEPGAPAPDLADALGALAAALGSTDAGPGDASAPRETPAGVLHVALLPPLGQLRRLQLPGLRVDEARQVLRREPSRHLPVPTSASLTLDVEGSGWRQRAPYTVFAAPRALVDGICTAARQSGWMVAEIVAAEAAWAASADALCPAPRGGEQMLIVCTSTLLVVVHALDGRVATLRRIPTSLPDAAALAASIVARPPASDSAAHPAVAVVGEPNGVDAVRAALEARGVTLAPRHPKALPDDSAAALAARFAPLAAGPVLIDDTERAALRRRGTRHTVARLLVAAVLLALAGAAQFWGVARERELVTGERAKLRDPVARALATRDSLAQTTQRLAILRATATGAPRWSALIASLSSELPHDAFLLSLRADPDTLRLEGSAAHAAPVFDALTRVPGVRSIRPEGPIRQQVTAGGTSERFTVAASLGRQR